MVSGTFKSWYSAGAVVVISLLLMRQHIFDYYTRNFAQGTTLECETPAYDVRILSFDPLMIHLENFITPRERKSILDYSTGRLQKSTILNNNGTSQTSDIRTSSTGLIPRNNSGAACVAKRFLNFQGFRNDSELETIQVTHYELGQQFKPHLDYRPNTTNLETTRFKRATTGFAILDSNCESCGTQFPLIPTNWSKSSPEWCRIVDCDEDVLTVKPLPGSVLFWQNVVSDGEVDRRMLHAGLPLLKGGSKTGLNLWTQVDLWENHIDHRR